MNKNDCINVDVDGLDMAPLGLALVVIGLALVVISERWLRILKSVLGHSPTTHRHDNAVEVVRIKWHPHRIATANPIPTRLV